jgi:hypothetical protein
VDQRARLAATCAKLGDSAWPLFQKYARCCWLDGENDIWADAQFFSAYLVAECSTSLNSAEMNRVGSRANLLEGEDNYVAREIALFPSL